MPYRAAVVGGRGEDWLEGLVYVFERRSKKEKGWWGGEGHGPIVSQRVERQEPGPQEGPPRLSTPEVCKKTKNGTSY